jgi:hypothetical protein
VDTVIPVHKGHHLRLRTLRTHGQNQTLTKDVYRNPVFHPEEIYTDERAQVLFGVCISAIVLIKSEITAQEAKSGTLAFPAAALAG